MTLAQKHLADMYADLRARSERITRQIDKLNSQIDYVTDFQNRFLANGQLDQSDTQTLYHVGITYLEK